MAVSSRPRGPPAARPATGMEAVFPHRLALASPGHHQVSQAVIAKEPSVPGKCGNARCEPKAGQPRGERAEDLLHLDPGQVRSKAVVGAVAECEVRVVGTGNVECLRVIE